MYHSGEAPIGNGKKGCETIIQIILTVINYEQEMHTEPTHDCVKRNDLFWRCFERQNYKVIPLVI